MDYYVVDAFTDKLFSGNPACICVSEKTLSNEVMQNIAFENNLSETAFIYKNGKDYILRWFTPSFEIDLLYSERDLYVVMNNEEVKNYISDYTKLKKLDSWLGIVITAKGNNADFVSRYFCPELMFEDPVTGSAHSTLVPIWSNKLGKNKLLAKQLSKRGGTLYCECSNNNIKISGNAVVYSKGSILL